MEENKNIGTCLVHYTISPALMFEGDEDDTDVLQDVLHALENDTAVYAGFTYPETPDRLSLKLDGHTTNVLFTVKVAGLTPFNAETDFKPGIIGALQHGDGDINEGTYYEDTGTVKVLEIELTNEI